MYAAETESGYSVSEMALKSKAIDVIQLTIVGDVDGSARIENGKNTGILEASGVFRAVLDLEEIESMSAHVCWVTRQKIHLGTFERRARTRYVGDGEGILGEGVQGPTGIVEKLEDLVTGVGDGRGDLQVLQSIDVDVGGRGPESQARGGRDDDRRNDKGEEGSTEGRREHCGERGEGC